MCRSSLFLLVRVHLLIIILVCVVRVVLVVFVVLVVRVVRVDIVVRRLVLRLVLVLLRDIMLFLFIGVGVLRVFGGCGDVVWPCYCCCWW